MVWVGRKNKRQRSYCKSLESVRSRRWWRIADWTIHHYDNFFICVSQRPDWSV